MPNRFVHYELRTTDVDAARAFYADLFEPSFWSTDVTLAPLPERVRALGVPSHWLGHLAVDDVDGTVEHLRAHGAEPRGPTVREDGGSARAILRDPFGAILAVSSGIARTGPVRVVRHILLTRDPERAFALYAELFGWKATERFDLGPDNGQHRAFVWDDSGSTAGSVSNAAGLPGVHAQWLYFFGVEDLEAAIAIVRARGGLALEPVRTARGDVAAACDDPQGAAFGLYQLATV
jgi:predicted enzyme related to lactoylglutathione lyase